MKKIKELYFFLQITLIFPTSSCLAIFIPVLIYYEEYQLAIWLMNSNVVLAIMIMIFYASEFIIIPIKHKITWLRNKHKFYKLLIKEKEDEQCQKKEE